jgi:hypothetical protein
MMAYQNCEVSEVMPLTLPSGVAEAGSRSQSLTRSNPRIQSQHSFSRMPIAWTRFRLLDFPQ